MYPDIKLVLPRNINNLTEREILEWAESVFARPKALQELPLILAPKCLFQTRQKLRRQSSVIKSSLDEWMLRAREDDELLRIERRFIPFAEIYIPDTCKGQKFFTIAKAFGEIPMLAGVIPKNQNQGYWLKTLHYFHQARGVLFAYKLLGVIPNPLEKQGLFPEYLPETSIHNLDLITNVDLAEYKLIKSGKCYIQEWCQKHNIVYPFKNSFELFLSIHKQAFLDGWTLGPACQESKWFSIEEQEDFLAVRIRLLEQTPWIKREDKRGTYQQQEQEYLKFLKNYQWYGYFILALRSQHWSQQKSWQQYTSALKAAKTAYINDFYWQGGQPYKAQEMLVGEELHQTRKTKTRQRVEGVVNVLGYILWQWT